MKEKGSPLRAWFDDVMPNLKSVTAAWKAAGPPTILPTSTGGPLGQVGAALDYRVRYLFTVTDPYDLMARRGTFIVTGPDRDQLERRVASAHGTYDLLAGALTEHLAAYPPVGQLCELEAERTLARFCFVLALFEYTARTGRPSAMLDELGLDPSLEALLGVVDDAWVDDIVALTAGFISAAGPLLERPIIANPGFASGAVVGGADADLIIDRTLLELKATVVVRPERWWVYQLLGYVFLDTENTYDIDQVGFALPRIPAILTWPIDELLATVTGTPGVTIDDLRPKFLAQIGRRRRT